MVVRLITLDFQNAYCITNKTFHAPLLGVTCNATSSGRYQRTALFSRAQSWFLRSDLIQAGQRLAKLMFTDLKHNYSSGKGV